MAKELLEKIPPEKRWEITAKTLLGLAVLQGEKIIAPEMGKDDGIIAPVLGEQKWKEINTKVYGAEALAQLMLWIKKTFDIPVEDAIGASKLYILNLTLGGGPDFEWEYIEKTPERVVIRYPKCPYMESYREFDVDPALIPCGVSHKKFNEEQLKKLNPRLTGKLTKAMPFGDPYCEDIIEFKDE